MPLHAQPLTIQKIKRTNKRIFIAYLNGSEKLTVNSDENALPEFHEALVRLGSLIEAILHVPTAWTIENLRVIGLTMGNQGEAQTVSILGQKSLSDASKAFNIVTPPRLLSHPTQPGSYTPPLTTEQAEVVYAMIEAAKNYVVGNRAQGMLEGLNLDEPDADPDYSHEAPGLQNLPFEEPPPEENPKKRKSRKTARA